MRLTPRFATRSCIACVIAIAIVYLTGANLYLFERDYFTEFEYPLNIDVRRAISEWIDGGEPRTAPVNTFRFDVRIDSAHKCRNALSTLEPVRLLLLVKSAVDHFENRQAIRVSWGWENRFSDVAIQRIFLMGLPQPDGDPDLQARIDSEQENNMDLVQAAFVDSYFNNTLKAILGLKWINEQCPTAEYILFVDDDYYVSTKNILRFIRRPANYPEYLKRALLTVHGNVSRREAARPDEGEEVDDDDDDSAADSVTDTGEVFVGYRFFSKPHRIRFLKWYVSLEEYPFNMFPPYITAGAYLMSRRTATKLYFASMYTMPFRFDDVYLGIVAKKTGIEPTHNENFYFYKPSYSATKFAYVLASHGFRNPKELISVWNEQRSLGNA